ncbi:Por secretion system C-terminal sorting domain-containing protein [Ekhidna lutea]|uniref:Por secretion system C-terminal sorting domain-containing protein n=1 Tax=Ekhidna lutea TaxID=447679 RepID=A0A239EKA9_EKHLU|nr:T9SS type A sorting domain-containing protein [Ekhidna lutea]SNS44831.1 Por secretion system C-terminal sorting domain-containing protein [Ekhidna lutea]
MRRTTIVFSGIVAIGVLATIAISILDDPSSAYQNYLAQKIEEKKEGKVKSKAPDIHALIQRELRTRIGEDSPEYGPNQVMEEFLKAKTQPSQLRSTTDLEFIERGPGNVAGRTRSILVDPDDTSGSTWFAGSASGGIWKTTDAGTSWTFISEDIPNLGTNTLAMSEANPNVIYAGTGEHFTNDIDGAGLFKSTDKGDSWTQIASPSDFPDFKNVSRIVVNPMDENEVVVTSRNSVWTGELNAAIYKSTDGGETWTQVRSSTNERYDDIAFDASNFNVLYVAIRGIGVIKSTDGGETWTDASNGMSPGGRVEIGISDVNPNRLWASVEGGLSGSGSDLYVSSDGGSNWHLVVNATGTNENFLGGQGWYDNYVTTHPFDEDIVYVGGVNNWKFELEPSDTLDVKSIDVEDGTQSFITYINFGGKFYGGTIDQGNVATEDLKSVEVRFGQGTQKAHRFTVDGQGSGVPSSGYLYQDYVDVPFQVWDTENNVQLMASFRDQQEDGKWNLAIAKTDGQPISHSREYVYIHDIEYQDFENSSIAMNGGIDAGQMYFFWPTLSQEAAGFDENNLPLSNLGILVTSMDGLARVTTSVSDAYGQFGGPNAFPQSSRAVGIHPDQHNSIVTDVDEANQRFGFLITNDGGVYKSEVGTDPGPNQGDFEYVSHGYNTTQFYGADKAPDSDRYIGGMQDNGTWYHSEGVEGSATAQSTFAIGGDGFEVLWHSEDKNKIIGGSQFNGFGRTLNGGATWIQATTDYEDTSPFITRLAHSKSNPDRIFTVGASGVWRSQDFGGSWDLTSLVNPDMWSFTNSADVEVSYSNPDIVWAGGRLYEEERLYVSTNGGTIFNPVNNYEVFEMGSVSGIATHPSEDNTAYALFSFAGYPKVLKTTDLGQTWEDISGFDGTGDRGFPDVAVNTLFVFPDDNNRIWVGSEIGIIESTDGGETWGLLESDFPAVNTYDFKLSGNTLVIATYGRGIWSVEIPNAPLSADSNDKLASKLEIYPNPIKESASIRFDNEIPSTIDVIDLNGRKVHQILPTSKETTWKPNLQAGIYVLRYEQNHRLYSQKVIVGK